ncbi:MAG: hypothetical protein WEB02_07040 [Methylophaga sp.]
MAYMDACPKVDIARHLYSRQHLWFSPLTDNKLVFGVSEFYQDQLSDVVFIEFVAGIGHKQRSGNVVCVIESAKSVTEISLPWPVTLVQINTELLADAPLINRQPETRAWLAVVQIETVNWQGNLLTAEQYQHYLDQ